LKPWGQTQVLLCPFQICPLLQVMQALPFQLAPAAQTQVLVLVLRVWPLPQVGTRAQAPWKSTKPAAQPHPFSWEFHTSPEGQVMQLLPFQLAPLGQAQALATVDQLWPVGQVMQVAPFQLEPAGQPQERVCWLHTSPAWQTMQTKPFQLPPLEQAQLFWAAIQT
jgi:hypothetical protein